MSDATWRLLDSGPADAHWNMAVDEAILACCGAGLAPPTLRFYRWEPPAVSLGYFQNAEKELDLEECRRRGVGWVRRLTGGRAVLHDKEVTYSVVIPEELVPGGVLETYRLLCGGLERGLRLLGLEARPLRPRPEPFGAAGTGPRTRSAACFDVPSWYELTVSGKKVVGSAQVRRAGAVLQHGSVVLVLEPERTASLLRLEPEARRRVAEGLGCAAAGVSGLLGREVGYAEVRDAVAQGFREALGIALEAGGLSPEEEEMATSLAKGGYSPDRGRGVAREGSRCSTL